MQTLRRTAIPLIKKYIVPAAKKIEADLFEVAVPEIGEVVSECKELKTFAKDVRTKTVRKQLGGKRRNPRVEIVESDPILEK